MSSTRNMQKNHGQRRQAAWKGRLGEQLSLWHKFTKKIHTSTCLFELCVRYVVVQGKCLLQCLGVVQLLRRADVAVLWMMTVWPS